MKQIMAPHNPFLAPDTGKVSTHFDCANTDVTPHAAWLGTQQVTPDRLRYVPGNLVNVGYAFTHYPDGSEALLYSGPTSVGKVRVDGGRFEVVHVLVAPGFEQKHNTPDQMRRGLAAVDAAGGDEQKMLAAFRPLLKSAGFGPGGMYTFLDRDGFYYASWGTKILKIADAKSGDVTSPITIVLRSSATIACRKTTRWRPSSA